MSILAASMLANASLLSGPRIDPGVASETVRAIRTSLLKTAFPYLNMEKEEPEKLETNELDEYFDELDAISAAESEEKAKNAEKPEDLPIVGDGVNGEPGSEMI